MVVQREQEAVAAGYWIEIINAKTMNRLPGVTLKSTIRKVSLWILLCMSICLVQAQADPILGKFSLSESKGQVAISWQIIAGNTCNGIQIYRSIDAVNFTRIGYIGGICGSIYEPVNYFFTDTTPVKNAVNYYYLEFGGVGSSQVIAIEVIDKGHAGYQIRPHPIQHSGTIYFDAQVGEVYTLRLYDPTGKEIFSAKTSDDRFDVFTSAYAPGHYVFTISASGNGAGIKGKLIIQK